jgi:hypothetical protein
MQRSFLLAGLALGTITPALAQSNDGEWRTDLAFSIVGAAIDDKTSAAPAADSPLLSGMLAISRSDTFENGLTLGWRGEVRYDRDAPSRPAFAGVLGQCPASDPACPRIVGPGGFLSPVSPATGLSAGGVGLEEDGFVAIESASVSLEGPWGQGILGLDSGAAARLDARAPTLLARVSAFSPGLDPTGLGVTRARNDVTASSLKAAYMSPRWVGFRVGVSYAPEANERTVDYDPRIEGPGQANPRLENVWEGAVSFARQFAEQDLRVRAALTYTAADAGAPSGAFGGYEAWGAGLELEHDGSTGGVRWLSSNNGWNSGNANYEAWEAGLVRQAGDWRLGLEGGWAQDGLTGVEGASWLVGISRKINDNVDLGLAWVSADADMPVPLGPSVSHTNASNDGLVVELTVRN